MSGKASTIVTFLPFWAKCNANSQPTKPPPITTTLSLSGTLFVNTSLAGTACSTPLIGGTTGTEPSHINRLSGFKASIFSSSAKVFSLTSTPSLSEASKRVTL